MCGNALYVKSTFLILVHINLIKDSVTPHRHSRHESSNKQTQTHQQVVSTDSQSKSRSYLVKENHITLIVYCRPDSNNSL
eukprot:scaffold40988_cov52-Attheya_sp.AAC.5